MTGRRTTDIEIQMAKIETKLDNIEENQNKFYNENRDEHQAVVDKIEKIVNIMEKKFHAERVVSNRLYADKRTEKVVWFALGAIGTTIIGFTVRHLLTI